MKIYLVWDDGDQYGPDAVNEGFVHLSRALLQRGLEEANKYHEDRYKMNEWEDGSIGQLRACDKNMVTESQPHGGGRVRSWPMNNRCDMCDGSGEGSGGWRGICGYCDGTGEGTCQECRYPSSDRDPPSMCTNHGPSQNGLENARWLREERLAWKP